MYRHWDMALVDFEKIINDMHNINPDTVYLVCLCQPIMTTDHWMASSRENPGFIQYGIKCEQYISEKLTNMYQGTTINIRVVQLCKAICEATEILRNNLERESTNRINWERLTGSFVNGIHLTPNGQRILSNEIYREACVAWNEKLSLQDAYTEN